MRRAPGEPRRPYVNPLAPLPRPEANSPRTEADRGPRRPSFLTAWVGGLLYPIRGTGPLMVLAAALLSVPALLLLAAGATAAVAGGRDGAALRFGVVLAAAGPLILAALLSAFYLDNVVRPAGGGPCWPERRGVFSRVGQILRFLALITTLYLPAVVVVLLVVPDVLLAVLRGGWPSVDWLRLGVESSIVLGGLLLPALLTPMATIIFCVEDSALAALNPLRLVRGIAGAPLAYLLVAISYEAILVGGRLAEGAARSSLGAWAFAAVPAITAATFLSQAGVLGAYWRHGRRWIEE